MEVSLTRVACIELSLSEEELYRSFIPAIEAAFMAAIETGRAAEVAPLMDFKDRLVLALNK